MCAAAGRNSTYMYSERLVKFCIDGLDYYLRTSHKSCWTKDNGDKNT